MGERNARQRDWYAGRRGWRAETLSEDGEGRTRTGVSSDRQLRALTERPGEVGAS